MLMDEQMQAIVTGLKPLSRLSSPREVVRQFTPNWVAATMGTGILAIALSLFPVKIPGLLVVAEGLWLFNIGLFALCTVLYAARWIFFFDGARRIFGHSVVSMFFGCIPMGLATIVNGFLIFGVPRWGAVAVDIAHALWWIDAVLAVVCGIVIPFMMFTRQIHSMEQMTAVWLLPVVAAEVAAVSGALLIPHLADPHMQMVVMFASYTLWACSVPLALSILVILVLRLAIHKLPPSNMAASSWLALGPLGTGALGLINLGYAAPPVFAAQGLAGFGEIARGIGLIGGVLLWGYGLWWMGLAILITAKYAKDGFPFNIGWWGYTFPLGVYAVATLRLAALFPLPVLAIFGGLLVIALAGLWLLVGALSIRGAWRGDLFVSPCLKEGN